MDTLPLALDEMILAMDLVASWQLEKVLFAELPTGWSTNLRQGDDVSCEKSDLDDDETTEIMALLYHSNTLKGLKVLGEVSFDKKQVMSNVSYSLHRKLTVFSRFTGIYPSSSIQSTSLVCPSQG